jgi:hypothetical protein
MGGRDRTKPRWMQPLEPPPCPPGWHTGPPDFVGVGAQRSGTSWWYRTIEQHPRVARIEGEQKELHYFGRFWQGDIPEDMVERYHRFFPRPPGSISGEWTPRYMYDFWSLRLLAQAAPEARLLVLLRDPVERYRSGVARQMRLAERDLDVNLMMFADSVARGLYHLQLRRVFEFFPRERVLVLQFERCTQDVAGQLRATCEFLGLEPFEQLPPRAEGRKRPPHDKPELADAIREELVARLQDDVIRLAQLCPEIDLELWPNFRHLKARPAAVAEASITGSAPL